MIDRSIPCPHCTSLLRVPGKYAGRKVSCKRCGTIFEAPPVEKPQVARSGNGVQLTPGPRADPGGTDSVERLARENAALREDLESLRRALKHERAGREEDAREHDLQVAAIRADRDREHAAWMQEIESMTASWHDAEGRHAGIVAERERRFREELQNVDRPAQESPDAVVSRLRLEADLAEKTAQLEELKAALLEAQNFQTRMKMVLSGLGIGLPN